MELLLNVLAMTAGLALYFVPWALLVAAFDPRYPWYKTSPIFVLVLLTMPMLMFALGLLVWGPRSGD